MKRLELDPRHPGPCGDTAHRMYRAIHAVQRRAFRTTPWIVAGIVFVVLAMLVARATN